MSSDVRLPSHGILGRALPLTQLEHRAKLAHTVGNDVITAMLDFLNTGNMRSKINFTHIVLIPKVKSPKRMFDYKPISLCNVIYKVISKVLANRLKIILP